MEAGSLARPHERAVACGGHARSCQAVTDAQRDAGHHRQQLQEPYVLSWRQLRTFRSACHAILQISAEKRWTSASVRSPSGPLWPLVRDEPSACEWNFALSQGERELILDFAAGVTQCQFVCIAHSEVAYEWVMEELVGRLVGDIDAAPIDNRLRSLLAFVRKPVSVPRELTQDDVNADFAAGWDERALHDAITVTACASFMQRLVERHGFIPWTKAAAGSTRKSASSSATSISIRCSRPATGRWLSVARLP